MTRGINGGQASFLETFFRRERQASELADEIKASGDEIEFCARVASEAAASREPRHDESDAMRIGYAIACAELAVVFRAMRRGGPPDPVVMAEARQMAIASVLTEPGCGAPELPEAVLGVEVDAVRTDWHAEYLRAESALVDIISTADGTGSREARLDRILEMAQSVASVDTPPIREGATLKRFISYEVCTGPDALPPPPSQFDTRAEALAGERKNHFPHMGQRGNYKSVIIDLETRKLVEERYT